MNMKTNTLNYNEKTKTLILNNIKYKGYEICELPANFGCIEFNEKPGISEWINYKGLTFIQE